MKEYYECHVTVEKPSQPAMYEQLAKDLGWKTSFIDGDPVLGQKVYFYFTCNHVDFVSIKDKMGALAQRLGPDAIRQKIEKIVYDTKTGLGV